jgi:hypothetical protein
LEQQVPPSTMEMIERRGAQAISGQTELFHEALHPIDEKACSCGRRFECMGTDHVADGMVRRMPQSGHHRQPTTCDGLGDRIVIVSQEI